MDEYRVNGIVLHAMDYKEKDILITLFTAELGKISAVLKGAKQPNAKNRLAGQPFCFAEWILVKRGEFFVVTQVNILDAFFDLTADYNKFVQATVMLKICNYILKPAMISEQMLVNLLKALKLMVYENVDGALVLIKFVLETLNESGYGLNFKTCGVCGIPIAGDIVLSSATHEFCCVSCSGGYGKQISKKSFSLLKIINLTPYEKLATIKEKSDDLLNALKIVTFDLENVFGVKLKNK